MLAGLTLIVFVVADVLHEYVVAPFAVKTADPPAHIVEEFTVTVGLGFTVTIDVADEVQVPVVPTIV